MELIRASDEGRRAVARTETFTGTVLAESRLSGIPGVMMNTLLFCPCARTHWHSHEQGQILQIVSGQGFVASADGELHVVNPGDTIWTPPGQIHYHGATRDNFMVHHAISLGDITWLDEVPDHVYGQPA